MEGHHGDSQDRQGEVPLAPPGVDVHDRWRQTRRNWRRFGPLSWLWLIYMVWPDHPWDDKVGGRQFADFGNFSYGVTCHAAHLPLSPVLRAAGAVEEYLTDWFPENGHWYGRPPYGDNPQAHAFIKQGYSYARARSTRFRRRSLLPPARVCTQPQPGDFRAESPLVALCAYLHACHFRDFYYRY